MQFCVGCTGAQLRHGKSEVNPVWGEHKLIIFKIMKIRPKLRSYLWKMVIVTYQCTTLCMVGWR